MQRAPARIRKRGSGALQAHRSGHEHCPAHQEMQAMHQPGASGNMSDAQKATSVEGPKGLRILVVEDDEDLREIITGSLAEPGYEVIQASSGAEALRRLQAAFGPQPTERPVDLVLSDVRMAEMDGLRLTENIRSAHWPIPVVLMSAFPSPDVRAEARRLRAALLPKPFRIESLRLIITITLPASRSHQVARPPPYPPS